MRTYRSVQPSAVLLQIHAAGTVRDHRVTGYPEDPTLHPGPRVGATLEMIAKLVHPEAWAPAR